MKRLLILISIFLNACSRIPVEIQAINAYRLNGQQLERVSKELKTATLIPPGEQRAFRLPPVDRVLGKNILTAWLTTELDRNCTPCVSTFDQQVRKGVAVAPGEKLKFEAIPATFDDLDLYKIVVRIKSPFFIADGSEVLEKEVQLTAEDNQYDQVRLFVPNGRGSDALLYRYRLSAVSNSGETFEQEIWQDGRSFSQFIGTTQLEGLLPDDLP